MQLHKDLSWFELQGSAMPSRAASADVAADDVPKSGASQEPSESKTMKDILYSVENLRKRPGAED